MTIAKCLDNLEKRFKNAPKEGQKFFKSITPIRTGNARRNTKLKKQNEITADYKYAGRLNKGYSQQAPEGMSKPTCEFLKHYICTGRRLG